MFNFNTDLADERRDIFRKVKNIEEVDGVENEVEHRENIVINRVNIINNIGEKALGKPIGKYITIDVKNLKIAEENEIQESANVVTEELKKLINDTIEEKGEILVVGLGNEYVTPDSLRAKGNCRN